MPDSPSPKPTPGSDQSAATRTVRTYKNREIAEAAVARLKSEGIEATILELATPPGRPALVSDAVRVVVDSEHATRATRLLLNLSQETRPEGAAGGASQERRRPRPMTRPKTGLPWLFILIAILGAGGAVFYFIYGFGVKSTGKSTERPRERYVNEDTNHDHKIDLKRYLASNGQLLREEADTDFDGKSDVISTYNFGLLKSRAMDLDHNGIMDQTMYYDYLGRPFYSQVLMNGRGVATKRTFYQESIEFEDWEPTEEDPGAPQRQNEAGKWVPDYTQPGGGPSWPFRVLIDEDADGNFDLDQTLNLKGEVIREVKLEKGAVENKPPAFPSAGK